MDSLRHLRISIAYLGYLVNKFLQRETRQFSTSFISCQLETQGDAIPALEVFAPIISKDFETLEIFISSIMNKIVNPVELIRFVTKEEDSNELNMLITDLKQKLINNAEIKVENEEDFLPQPILDSLNEFPKSARGWLTQQFIKLWAPISSDYENVLIVDSDTILLMKESWVNSSGKFGIFPNYHSHEINDKIYEFFPKVLNKSSPKSCYVSHHMVFKKSIMKCLLSRLGHIYGHDYTFTNDEKVRGLYALVSIIEKKNIPSFSEWQLYADFAVTHFPKQTKRLIWSNVELKVYERNLIQISEAIADLEGRFRSVSLHKHTFFGGQ